MDCESALRDLSRYLDKELSEGPTAELEQHLQECRHCFSMAEFEQRLRAIIRRSCASEQVPPELEQRLRKLLRSF
jgi:mycothiol system anti-sigma-R factor